MLFSLGDKTPKIHETAFIAPSASIIGDAEIGAGSSVWFNCVLRADLNFLRIGERSNVQDGTVIHVDSGEFPTIIGDDVLIGHLAMVHGCTLKNKSFVGLSCTVMDGCTIEEGGVLAAGSLLSPGKTIGRNELWMGRPAKMVRVMTDEEAASFHSGAPGYAALAKVYLKDMRTA